MTYGQIKKALLDAGIDSADFEAVCLIDRFCGADANKIRMYPETDYTQPELSAAVERRISHYPLQYIVGEWEFFGCNFKVNENCLIPRYDTEISVEAALKFLKNRANPHFADLCTGSGCIAVALLKNLPDSQGIALEKFPETLNLAVDNAKLNGVSERFTAVNADVFDGFLPCGESTLNLIISNPPYIPTEVIKTLSAEVGYEPSAALDGGGDGMDFYRAIIPKYAKYLKSDGVFVFEIGYDQSGLIRREAEVNGFDCKIFRDLDGHERTAVLSHKMI